ncbi:hypothetical protein GCM10010404_42270 [Nonomuraea africana]
MELAARVGDLRMLPGNLATGLGPVGRSLLLATQRALEPFEFPLRPAQKLRTVDLAAVRQNREMPQPEIDPDLGRGAGQRLLADLDDEAGDIPPGRILDDRDRAGLGRQGT